MTDDELRMLSRDCSLDWSKGWLPLDDGPNRLAVFALSAPDDAEPAATEERERCKKACEAVAEQVTYQRDSQGAVEKCIAAIDALGVAP